MRSNIYFQKVRAGLVLLLLAGAVPDVWALGSASVVLSGSTRQVAAALPAGTAAPSTAFVSSPTLTSAETNAPLDFEVAFKMRNFPELRARVGRGERISRQEMADKYEPLPADYQAVADWLTSEGLTITRRDSRHLAIFARGKIGHIAQALQVRFARVTAEGKEYTSAVTPPSVPSRISSLLIGINGLQPHIQAHKHLLTGQAQPNGSSGGTVSYLPSQIAQAYGVTNLYNNQISGSGQTIAIVIDTFPSTTDLLQFWKNCHVNQSIGNIQFVQAVPGVLDTSLKNAEEATLDAEWSSSMAPGAHVRIYATVDLGNAHLDEAYLQILDDAQNHPELGIHQMSMSYGEGETYVQDTTQLPAIAPISEVTTADQDFALLEAAGVTPFASSGDGGATPGTGAAGDRSGPLQVEYPASDPNVIGVGGTSLSLDANNNLSSESVWNNSTGASGGGISMYFSPPSWQTGTGQSKRTVPDVAASADPFLGAIIYQNGAELTVGGTSWSSPTWAAICALMNQARENVGLQSFGGGTAQSANPSLGSYLYGALNAGQTTYSANFNDTQSGNNATSNSGTTTINGVPVPNYTAAQGYDLCTGIGSPISQALTQTVIGSAPLVGVQMAPAMVSIKPGDNATLTVAVGGSSATYQWQQMPAGSTQWNNLSDDGTYSGSSTAALTVADASTTLNGDQFQCVITLSGTSVTSTPTVLVVETPLIISTLAGTSGATGDGTTPYFNYPSGVALDSGGNIFVADFNNNNIRKVTTNGVVSTPYGSRSSASGAANANGNNATFNEPNSVAFDPSGNLDVADTKNNLIREISPLGDVTTLAGAGGGVFNQPEGVAVDGSGNVYVADTGNNVIRKIDSSGNVTTFAGQLGTAGYADGDAATTALFNAPSAVAVDSLGNVYVADFGNFVVRKISGGVVSTFAGQSVPVNAGGTAGSTQVGVSGYLDGPGSVAMFNAPIGLAVDSANNVYVADCLVPTQLTSASGNAPATYSNAAGNDLLRKITPEGIVSTLAGQAGNEGTTNGTGSAAEFYSLQAVVSNDATNAFYLADTYNQTIRLGIPLPMPAVSIAATQPFAQVFGPTPGQFTVTRTGDTSASLTVSYSTTGSTAVAGRDFTALSGTVMIPAGQSSAVIAVNPIANSNATSSPALVLTLATGPGFTLGNSATATVSIEEMTLFQVWEAANYPGETTNLSIVGPTSAPSGVPNLLDYAFDGNPSSSQPASLPVLTTVPVNGQEYLALTVTMLTNDPNLIYTVQVTGDLTQQTDPWRAVGVFTSTTSNSSTIVSGPQTVSGNTTVLTVRDDTPISTASPRFMRVQVGGH